MNKRIIPHWRTLPRNRDLKERARKLRQAKNLSEVLFWNQVKRKQCLGLDFDRQTVIGNYIVDFYCKPLGIIVEIDGKSHDNKKEYDQRRDEYLEGLGLVVIHIPVIEVFQNMEDLMEWLKRELRKYM